MAFKKIESRGETVFLGSRKGEVKSVTVYLCHAKKVVKGKGKKAKKYTFLLCLKPDMKTKVSVMSAGFLDWALLDEKTGQPKTEYMGTLLRLTYTGRKDGSKSPTAIKQFEIEADMDKRLKPAQIPSK